MVKNFFEYVKELVPEKGSVFFTLETHSVKNDISLYELADLLCGKKGHFATDVIAYSWNVMELWKYTFPTMGIMFDLINGKTRWCHFSKEAFVGAICIVAIRNGVTFDDEAHEELRQLWERKLEGKETEEEREKFEELKKFCSNFDGVWYIRKRAAIERGNEHYRGNINEDYDDEEEDAERKRFEEEEAKWYARYCEKQEQYRREREEHRLKREKG